MGKLIDLTGKKYGRLSVIARGKTYRGMVFWQCRCDCGNEIEASSGHLRYGHTKSCGCYANDIKSNPNKYDLSGEYGICYFNSAGFFIFDKEDYNLIKDYTWVKSNVGYVMSHRHKEKTIMLHRLIMSCPEDRVVDHINHNTLDNRKSNLRICTQQQNCFNRNKLGIRQRDNAWEASIKCSGKNYYLGSFDSKEKAREARKNAEQKYFGEYAYKEMQNDR